MADRHGGARAGSGRPSSAGTLSRRAFAVRAAAADALLVIARDTEEPASVRLRAAQSAVDALRDVTFPSAVA